MNSKLPKWPKPRRALTSKVLTQTSPNLRLCFIKRAHRRTLIRKTLVKGNGIAKIESTQLRRGAQICLSNEVYFS